MQKGASIADFVSLREAGDVDGLGKNHSKFNEEPLMPIVKQAGIDPIYFGVMFIMNNAIGLLTPPVGTVLNVVSGVARLKLDEVVKGVMPFLIAQVLLLFLFVMVPQLITVPAQWFYR